MRIAFLCLGLSLVFCGGRNSNDLVWSGEKPPTTAWLTSVWASGDHDVYAVGFGSTIIHSNNDGSAWTAQSAGSVQADLWGVGGSSANDVYAVGEHGLVLHNTGDGHWIPEATPTDETLVHVWAIAANDVYIVGGGGTIVHGDGSGTWVVQKSGTTDRLWGVWASGANDVYVVGGKTGVLQTDQPAESLILHSSDGGATWTPQQVPAGRDLTAVWGTPSRTVIAAGWDRILRSTDGATWSEVPSAGAIAIAAIAGGANKIYVAGGGITVASTDQGATWQEVLGGFDSWGAWVTPRGDCFIVGTGSDGNGGPAVGAIAHGQ